MKLVATVVRKPDFPATELEQLRNESVTALEAQRREPDEVAKNALFRHGNPHPRGDVRYTATFDESIADVKGVTLERVRAFHRDFYGASSAEFAAVGDFDAAALKAQLATLFGDWTSAKPYARVPNPLYTMPPVELRPDTLKTEDAADEYARLVALTHPKSRIELRDNSGIVREYGPMGSKPDHA